MQNKRSNFKAWVEKVKAEWKHVPSLKGKQAERNLGILRLLTVKKPMSAWDLALEYLKLTNEDFQFWNKDKIYHQRQIENAKMNRRLKSLVKNQYVRKLDSIYNLTAKGFFSLMAFDPTICRLMPNYRFNETLTEINLEKPSFLNERDLSQQEVQSLKSAFQNQIANETLSFLIKRVLIAWKINLDDVEERELFHLIFRGLERRIKKLRKKSMRAHAKKGGG